MPRAQAITKRVFLVSYATSRFEDVRRDLVASAISQNILNVFSYDEPYLQRTEFYATNKELLDEICGGGFWAWKPYLILDALNRVDEDDILLYCDAGTAFIASPQPLIDLCRQNARGVILFDARPLTNRQFTKRDCFVRLRCDAAKHWNATKVIATVLVIRKTQFALEFVAEWQRFCQDRQLLSYDDSRCGLPELEGFAQHRSDQAILSVLASKYGMETYRNPSKWGNFLKLPALRVPGELVCSPYGMIPEISDYAAAPQRNSPYGTIFEFNRMPNMVGKPPMVQSITFPETRRSLARRVARRIRSAARLTG